MKKKIDVIKKILVYIAIGIILLSVVFLIFTMTIFNDSKNSIFGYRTYLVLSDSMKKTDFKAGDLIVVKDVDYKDLKPGDIISYISKSKDNYGNTVTHKIKSIVYDEKGNPGYITYGTTTGALDEEIIDYSYIIGKYQFKIPNVANVVKFLKTVPGYIIFVFLPFFILIILQVLEGIKIFKVYHTNQLEELKRENEQIMLEYKNLEKKIEKLKNEKKIKSKKRKTTKKKTKK